MVFSLPISDEALEIEEGRILNFSFSNFTLNDLYVYIFCFEETGELTAVSSWRDVLGTMGIIMSPGSVKFVGWDMALHPHRTPQKTPLKKLLQAYIPQGLYAAVALHIY